jgi:hypothetical protein
VNIRREERRQKKKRATKRMNIVFFRPEAREEEIKSTKRNGSHMEVEWPFPLQLSLAP